MVGEVAIADGETGLFAFDPATGARAWTPPHARGPIVTPAGDPASGAGGVLVYTEGLAGKSAVVAVELSNRAERWRVRLRAPIFGAPTIADGRVYVGGRDQFLYAIDLVSGKVVWKHRAEGPIDASPAVAGGKVLVASHDDGNGTSRLFAFDAATGKVVWSFSRVGGLGVSAVTVAGGRAFVGFNDASVRAFDVRDGTGLWTKAVRASVRPPVEPRRLRRQRLHRGCGGGRVSIRRTKRRPDMGVPVPRVEHPRRLTPRLSARGSSSARRTARWGPSTSEAATSPGRPGSPPAVLGRWLPRATGSLLTILNRQGGIVALEPDPDGHLIDEESPTTLHVPVALATFAVATVLVSAGVLGLFRLLSLSARRRRTRGGPGIGPDDLESSTVGDGEDE